jgi:rhombotail lipoprotein
VMVQLLIIATSFIVALSAGCASSQGFDRTAMNEALHIEPTPIPESQPLASQGIHLSTPLRLGVFFVNHDFPHRQSIRTVEWLARDRDQLLLGLAPLQDTHVLQDAFVLMDATLRGEDINGIRQAGARYGADVVLIVDGVAAVDRYNNRFAWLYPTLLGTYLAPGTESDALVMVTGGLWAVRSEWHVPIQTVEGVSKLTGSAVLVEDTTALREAKERAIQAISAHIADQLRLALDNPSHTNPHHSQ